jgi:hypothetical protein
MKLLLILILLLPFLPVSAGYTDSLNIVTKGKTKYCISVESINSGPATSVLQSFIDSISGVRLSLVYGKTKKKHLIRFISTGSQNTDSVYYDGFVISTRGKDILIYANNTSGFRNAVYYILEHSLGCRYFASDAVKIPKRSSIRIAPLNTVQNPAFEFRINYNGGAFDQSYVQWHGLHNKIRKQNATGFEISDNWGLWVHTLHRLVPPENWFKSHPEYYALRNGIRIPDQLCLSNPEVLKIVIASLYKEIKLNPNPRYWSVSQMDNFNYCQCDKCKAIDDENGSPSGSIITFVNAVAKQFPGKIISTLAYQYSRKAPLKVKPLSNVNIMLCTIECDRNKPISADETEGSFRDDLEKWGSITNNILVWDYVINFSNIIGPFPNFNVLKPNLGLFEKNHVSMIFEQGWPRNNGEFTELRCYLLSKLMWNPAQNVDSLMQDFCSGYYGQGGKYICQYIQLATQNLLKSGKALTLYEPMSVHARGFLSPQNLESYFALLGNAQKETKGHEPYYHRVEMAMQPLRYAWLEVAKSLPFTNDWIFEKSTAGNYVVSARAEQYLQILCEMAKTYGPVQFHETGIKPQEYYDSMKKYFYDGIQMHKAIGKNISFTSSCSPKYNANGTNSLVDGVCGTENYFSLWQGWYGEDIDATIDLSNIEIINSVGLNCLVNQMSWIFPPESITVSISSDNKNFTEVSNLNNAEAGIKTENKIIPYRIEFQKPQQCRYLKIKIKNIGKLPDWRGVDGSAWLFVDEIIVK